MKTATNRINGFKMKNKKINDYGKSYHSKSHHFMLENEEYYQARAKISYRKYFSDLDTNKLILEYGVGLGQNIAALPNAYGYDISMFALKQCSRRGLKVFNKKKPRPVFDIVFSRHMLEHSKNPIKELKLMRKWLKPNGTLRLVLPIERQKMPLFSKISLELSQNQHLYGWNYQTINNLLINSGFKPIENKILRGTGYKKLLFLSKSIPLYHLVTRVAAIWSGSKEMMITAVKENMVTPSPLKLEVVS